LKDPADVEFATVEWAHCFNNRKFYETISNILRAEREEIYYATLIGGEEEGLKQMSLH